MKKFTLILSFLIAVIDGNCTNVSGGIFTNTTWTLVNSPYIVTDTVMVFGGITLTIEPGVVVKFNKNGWIDIRGSLYAKGTAGDSIIFTSNSLTPYAGIYQGVSVQTSTATFSYCSFSYATIALDLNVPLDSAVNHCEFYINQFGLSGLQHTFADTCTFKQDTYAVKSQSSIIRGCTFNNNTNGVTSNEYSVIENCTMNHNGTGISGYLDTIKGCSITYSRIQGINEENDSITNCDIEYNKIGVVSENGKISFNNISNNYIGIETYGDSISCNSICSNTDYNLVTESSNNLSVANNYWCLPDSANIQATIYDGHQKLTLGLVYFMPFDMSQCSITTGGKNLITDKEGINVFPNPNNGEFRIELQNRTEKSLVEIYNTLGQKIYKVNLASDISEIDFNNQPQGIYLYRVNKENGELIGQGKVIIQ